MLRRYWVPVGVLALLVAAAFAGLLDAHLLAGHPAGRHDAEHVMPLPTGTAADAHRHSVQKAGAFEREMERDMATMMRAMHLSGYSGNPDIDFLAMMIPHHQGAIDMARLILTYGDDPLTRKLAEEIIAAQQAEIAAMEARLAILRQGPDPAPGGFPALTGTRGR